MTSIEFQAQAITREFSVRAPRRAARAASVPAPELSRRVLNVAVAAAGIVATAPLMAAIAALIKLTSSGPAIYKQERVGVDRRNGRPAGNFRRSRDIGGRPFTIYKFRTMRQNGGGDARR